jgi:hypothetical protein
VIHAKVCRVRLVLLGCTCLFAACGGGGGGAAPVSGGDVTIGGRISFDGVPFNTTSGAGLDFNNIQQRPARGVTVQAMDATNRSNALAATTTDHNGDYSLSVAANRTVFIRVRAEMVQAGSQSFDFSLLDNTQGNAQYALDGSDFNTGNAAQTRNLNAASGWDSTSNSYTGVRAAAPFAILDAVFDGLALVLAADAGVQMATLNIHWSPNNRPSASINFAVGDIGTTSFFPLGANPGIYVLGLANNDTDEFDRHVLVHEWAHYLEFALSRSDTLGGPHGIGEQLDLRLAFGEGWGNALSGIATGDPEYRDSYGSGQGDVFGFNVEAVTPRSAFGWYSEQSVQEILYDLFDADADGVDNINLGFDPLYDVFVNTQRTTPAVTSIFSFIDGLKLARPQDAAAIDALLASQVIDSVVDAYGTGETNAGSPASADVLPIYKSLNVGATTQVCSDNDYGTINKLGVHGLLRFTASANADYQFTATAVIIPPGILLGDADPDMVFYDRGRVQIEDSITPTTEVLTRSLTAGEEYVLDVYEFANTTPSGSIGRTCFDVSVVQL